MTHTRTTASILLLLLLGMPLAVPPTTDEASAAPPPDHSLFQPTPLSQRQYSIEPPPTIEGPTRTWIRTPDGTPIFVETYLPGPAGPLPAPDAVPTVLVMTPYGLMDDLLGLTRHQAIIQDLVPYGYAVAIAHVPGTGNSGGCLDIHGPTEIAATASVIGHLGRAPWSNGRVGMLGISYDALTQIAAASLGDPANTSYLKAIIPVAGFPGEYDTLFYDGVSRAPMLASYVTLLYAGYAGLPPNNPLWQPLVTTMGDRYVCTPDNLEERAASDLSGNYSTHWAVRDARRGTANVQAAVLMVNNVWDPLVLALTTSGWFNRLPSEVMHKAILTQAPHAWPNETGLGTFARADWPLIVRAWFDHHLLGLPTGVADWPAVQIQDTAARWREARSWPDTGGSLGQLGLYADSLGATTPTGSSTFVTDSFNAPGEAFAWFRTEPLNAPLHITGMPVVDLWVQVEDPTIDLIAILTWHRPDGSGPVVLGARSVSHLDPMPHDRFEQVAAHDPPLDRPFRAVIRMEPTDLIVPAGAVLELRIGAGTTIEECLTAIRCHLPPTDTTTVRVLHDCSLGASVLRFEMPPERPRSLGVQRLDGTYSEPLPRGPTDGGGLASARVCGAKAVAPLAVTRGVA